MPNLISFKRTPVQITERAQNTGCDLQCRKMSEFSKTEYALKTPLQIANEGQRSVRVPYEYPPRKRKILHRKRMRVRLYTRRP